MRSTGPRPASRRSAISASIWSADTLDRSEARATLYDCPRPVPTLPVPTVIHAGDDYRLTLEILPDPRRDVLLVRYSSSRAPTGWWSSWRRILAAPVATTRPG